MIKKLVPHGNDLALIIDKPILKLLNITADTPLEVTTDGRHLIVSSVQDIRKERMFKAAIEKTNKEFEKTLRKLAE